MTQWSDLPREIQVEIIKFVVAGILQDHIDRVPPGQYWGPYPDYIDPSREHSGSYVSYSDIDEDADEHEEDEEEEEADEDEDEAGDYEHDIYTKFGDGCSIQKEHESSQLKSMLTVSKAFLTSDDLKSILLRCGHVTCPTPKSLTKLKDSLTTKERRNFCVMWIRPRNTRMVNNDFQLFGPDETGLSLYRFLLLFPNLKLVNLQLEQYLRGRIRLCWRGQSGRVSYPTECQDVLQSLYYYRGLSFNEPADWLRRLVLSSVVLDGKMELRLSFGARTSDGWPGKDDPWPVASFSSKDFCVRLNYEGEEWMIKQPRDEQYYREQVLEKGMRSSFRELPKGLQAIMSARASNKK